MTKSKKNQIPPSTVNQMAAKVAKAMKKQMKPPKKAPNYKSNRGQGKSRRNKNARIGKAARKAAIGAAYAVGDVDHSRAQADSQDCFLYGLYDPSKGSRGPPPVETAQVPTVVIPYTAVTLFKTTKNPATDDTTQFINILPETGTGHSVAWHTYCDPTTDDVANQTRRLMYIQIILTCTRPMVQYVLSLVRTSLRKTFNNLMARGK